MTSLRAEATAAKKRYDRAPALEHYKQILPLQVQLWGRDHIGAALTLRDIGIAQEFLRRYDEALATYQQMFDVCTAAVGADHPETIYAQAMQARCLQQLGRLSEAETLARPAYSEYLAVVGPQHMDTPSMTTDYMHLLQRLIIHHQQREDYATALACAKEAYDVTAKVYGEDNWRSVDAAVELDFARRFESADEATRRRLLKLAEIRYSMVALIQSGKAAELYRAAESGFELARDLLGPRHSITGRMLIHLAEEEANAGRYERGLKLYREAVAIYGDAGKERTPDYAYAISGYGVMLSGLGHRDEAEPLVLKSLDLQTQLMGKSSLGYARANQSVGAHFHQCGEYEKATPYLQESLQTFRSLGRPTTQNALIALRMLAANYRCLGELREAEEATQQFARLVEQVYGKDHRLYESVLDEFGRLRRTQSRYGEALDLHRSGLELAARTYGPESRRYELQLRKLAEIHARKNEASLST